MVDLICVVRLVPKWFAPAAGLPWLALLNVALVALVGHVGSEMLWHRMDARGMLMDSPVRGVPNTRT